MTTVSDGGSSKYACIYVRSAGVGVGDIARMCVIQCVCVCACVPRLEVSMDKILRFTNTLITNYAMRACVSDTACGMCVAFRVFENIVCRVICACMSV